VTLPAQATQGRGHPGAKCPSTIGTKRSPRPFSSDHAARRNAPRNVPRVFRKVPRTRINPMPAKAKLSDAQVKKISRRVRAGASRTELATEYGVNRKTIWRHLDALELAEAERAQRSEVGGSKALAPEHPQSRALASPSSPSEEPECTGRPASAAARRRASSAWIRRFHPDSYEAWLDERDARVPAPPDPRVRLVTESGSTVGSTRESNAERMASALEPYCGPLSVVPA
jgi:hypothetical protein